MLHAFQVDPSRVLLEKALTARTKWIDARCLDSPADVVFHRSQPLATLSAMSERLVPPSVLPGVPNCRPTRPHAT